MDGLVPPIEQMLKFRASRQKISLSGDPAELVFSCTSKASCWEPRNKMLKAEIKQRMFLWR